MVTLQSATFLFLACVASAPAAPLMVAIAGDNSGVPRSTQVIDAGTVSPAGNLGDGSIGFTGGLANLGSSFAVVGNDSMLNSTLYTFTTPGDLAPVLPLGAGFYGGLAWDGALIYAVSNDWTGASTLNAVDAGAASVTPLFALGSGFTGGMTYNPADSLLYAIANDSWGQSTLYSIDRGTASVTALSIALGFGFYGGLSYDPADQLFYAIASDSFGASSLYSFALSDAAPTLLSGLGDGYLASGLALGSLDPTDLGGSVPEPSSFVLLGSGLTLAGLVRRHHRR